MDPFISLQCPLTANMAWIGDDGLVHTPQGGVYAKTTEAVANFRRQLKYDNSWHRARQRHICLILLIMFLTLSAVVVLLIERPVNIEGVSLQSVGDGLIWKMDECETNQSVSDGCNVTISPLLSVNIHNENWVPATVNSWTVRHTFYCSSLVRGCIAGGSDMGTVYLKDGQSEINRKDSDIAILNDTASFMLPACKLGPLPNGTYCEWQESCLSNVAPKHFLLDLHIEAALSFALQSATRVVQKVTLGMWCNGTGVVCKVGDDVIVHSAPVCS